ncbi:histone deacetylase HDT2-like [Impatiens glandulifera]|uniref:histone deacetylase HDT2-like n=1 Tax=Impatiens glandulifera TaxID=253017 RepID=UPI001FB0F856|nr:histone deacetylase HDT2-like [Impatiens glandulifera]
MEFWGVEVKAGETLKVVPEEGSIIHISQAALGDSKVKGKGFIPLRLKIEDKKFILGSLSGDGIPHVTFDLVFHTEFELSHDAKDTSVFFLGYKGEVDDDEEFPSDSEDESLDSEDELAAVNDETLKKLLGTTNGAKPKSDNKAKVAVNEPVKKSEDDDSSDEDDEDDDDSSDDDIPAIGEEDDSDDDSDDDADESSEEEETPKEVTRGKKRTAESPKEIPSSAKKAKVGGQASKAAIVKAAAAPAGNKPKGQAQKFQGNKGKKGGK